jgi:hypothetical protein
MAWKFSLLVVANVTASSDELLQALKDRAARDSCKLHLLVPATGHGRGGREGAQARLDAALERMRDAGLEVEGTVGDPDPIAAVHDSWDPKLYDEIVISTLPTGASRWLQADLPHRVEKMTGVHVTHVVAEEEKEQPRVEHVERERKDYGLLSPLAALGGKRSRRT